MSAATPAQHPSTSWHPSVEEQLFGDLDPEAVLRQCGRTFYAASRVLPRQVREDLSVLYAFCRVVDDCADTADTDRAQADALLNEIEAGLDGRSRRSPVVESFRRLAVNHAVPLDHARELIAGVRSDMGHVRFSTSSQLIQYAYRVASTVGLMMCRVLDVHPDGDAFAIDLGIGMQLTNIARDVAEDARNDRIYLPAEWVDHDVLLSAIRDGKRASAGELSVADAIERLLTLADNYYESAELGMHYLPPRVRGGIRSAAWNYRAIGSIIRRKPQAALARRASTRSAGKLMRTGAALWASVLESLPLGPADRHDRELHTPLLPLGVVPGRLQATQGRQR